MKKWTVCLLMCLGVINAAAQYHSVVLNSTNTTVTMRCIGYGKKAPLAAIDAELSAIKTLLFSGAKNTPFSNALIQEDKLTTETKFKKFFSSLYSDDYKQFVESSVISVPFGKNELKQKCITMDVCLRVSELRKYLEQHKIIRKFGL